jgi:hypothetical protein
MYEIRQLTGLEYDPTYAGASASAPSQPVPAVAAVAAVAAGGGQPGDPIVPEATIGRRSSRDLLVAAEPLSLDEILAVG